VDSSDLADDESEAAEVDPFEHTAAVAKWSSGGALSYVDDEGWWD
jgi:hypothetical protein